MRIIKSSGKIEGFSQKKLIRSLKRSGLSHKKALRIADSVFARLPKKSTTDKIYKHTRQVLAKEQPVVAFRYSLKRAIMEMGPTGFPFEKLVAKIIKAHGFSTKVGTIHRGYCVNHEVDVIAKKGNREIFIECKYHSNPGRKTDIGVMLYSHARFQDITKAHKKRGSQSTHEGWVVTNTRVTSEAIKYSKCSGIKIVSWDYPRNNALKELMEEKGIYPITVIPFLQLLSKQRLFEAGVVMVSDILKKPLNQLAYLTQEPRKKLIRLQEIARDLTKN